MLTTIGLKNFKVFADLPQLGLAKLTVLAGPNSSGKSSIIQALLLLKQTLESPSSEDAIILNGSWVALGEFDDVLSFSAQHGEGIGISVALHFPADRDTYYTPAWRAERRRLAARYRRVRPGSAGGYIADLTLRFEGAKRSGASSTSRSQIILKSTQLQFKIEEAASPVAGLVATDDHEVTEALKSRYEIPHLQIAGHSEHLYPATLSGSAQARHGEVVACALEHFLPYEVWAADPSQVIERLIFAALRHDAPDALEQADAVARNRYLHAMRTLQQGREEDMPPAASESLKDYLSRLIGDSSEVTTSVNKYLQSDDGEKWEERFERAKTKPPLSPKPLRFTLQARNLDVPVPVLELDPDAPVLDLNTAVNDIAGYFTNDLYYLGPLREEPRAFYRRLGSSDPMYVGQRGENTAFVLKYYGSRNVRFVEPPSTEGNWNPRSGSTTTTTLERAVKAWMRYLHLASDLEIRDVGKIGLSIQARVRGDKRSTDLTNVGVGVSQALPLIVLGLASPPGATLLVEQPELHLHPYVQSRLADFFLSLTATGKQVIAETHSEHLIHRMRLYVARGELAPDRDLAIYFFADHGDASGSEVRRIQIGALGEINEWPEGFFDETTKQLDAILDAALERTAIEEDD